MNISSSILGKKYEEVYYKIFRITANMLAISRMKDGIFMQVNDAFMTILGYSRDELIGKSSLEIGLFVNAQDRVNMVKALEQHRQIRNVEIRFRAKDGRVVDTLFSADTLTINNEACLLTMAIDITGTKQAEENLRESNQRLNQLAEQSRTVAWEINPEGLYTYVSQVSELVFGFSPGELINKKYFYDLHPADQRNALKALTFETIARKKPFVGYENPILTKDGRVVWVSTNGLPMLKADGTLLGYRGSDTDITQRRQMEEALRNSLREKESLIREIHHRVKNNMQIISSLLQLQANQVGDDVVRLLFTEAKDRIRSMSLVHEKLYKTGQVETIDLGAYANDLVINLFRSHGISHNRVRFRLEGDSVKVAMDNAIPLALILNELISNSLKYAFPGNRKGEIYLQVAEKEGIVTLGLADDGVGIPANVDIAKAGTLGLTLVRALTEQLRGSIELRRDGGTRYSLSFKNNRIG